MSSAADFYDDTVPKRLRDFTRGNLRIETAWQAIVRGTKSPRNILEIGCGIGFVSWWMKRKWPDASVTGVDFSPASIDLATQLFAGPGIRYEQGRLEDFAFEGTFDLIVMMDVYEHVPISERVSLHRQVDDLLDPRGALFLSFPTPEYQAYLRVTKPRALQPVDNDVSLRDLQELAEAVDGIVVSYRSLNVWRRCDYAHCWIRRDEGAGSEKIREGRRPLARRIRRRLESLLPDLVSRSGRERLRRERLVSERLGSRWEESVSVHESTSSRS